MTFQDMHIGRHWPGSYNGDRSNTIEAECPCPVEPCGLVDPQRADPSCEHHSALGEKTIRTSHFATECPGA